MLFDPTIDPLFVRLSPDCSLRLLRLLGFCIKVTLTCDWTLLYLWTDCLKRKPLFLTHTVHYSAVKSFPLNIPACYIALCSTPGASKIQVLLRGQLGGDLSLTPDLLINNQAS